MAGRHHRFSGHELRQTPGNGEEQGSLVCQSPWGLKDSDMTWQLNNNMVTQAGTELRFQLRGPGSRVQAF